MDVSIITQGDVLRESCEALQLQHNEKTGQLYAQIPASVELLPGDSLGFPDISGRYRIFEITNRERREPDGIWSIDAIDKAIRELEDDPVTDVRARDSTIVAYLTRLLQGTRYTIGRVAVSTTGTSSGYYESVWSAMAKAAEAFDVRLVPYYTMTDGRITGRLVDILSTAETYRGRIFELGDDLTGLSIAYDDSQIKTALYGRGQGVQIDGGDGDDPAYGRRLTFADVVWSTAEGDPVDKPAGQEWVGDPVALATYGRDGNHRYGFITFDQVTDPEELLQKTWEYLQQVRDPVVSVSCTVRDTASLQDRIHEAVELGESVLVRAPRMINGEKVKTDIRARVVDVVRDYVQPDETKITIGNAALTATSIVQRMAATVDSYSSRAAVWDRANAFDLQGAMDVINNQIRSSVGHWYTDSETGAMIFEQADGQKAMKLTGAGWQIASGKDTSGAWIWRTAATGDGIVADTISSGRINAGLVTIGGTGTTLDGTSIVVLHPSVSSTAKTVIDANGLRMYDGARMIGGIATINSTVTSVIEALHNAVYPDMLVDVGEFYSQITDAVYGLRFKYNGTATLKMGVGFIEGSVMGAEIISDMAIHIYGTTYATISAGDCTISLDADGDITFTGKKPNGEAYTFTGYDVYRRLD